MTPSTGHHFFRHYRDIIFLLSGIIAGTLAGWLLQDQVLVLKPIGDIFLNLLFTAVVPMVFFAISSAVATLDSTGVTARLVSATITVFIITVLLAAMIAVIGVHLFPVTQHLESIATTLEKTEPLGEQLVKLVSVGEFFELLSRKNMLALIIFSLLTGIAARKAALSGESFRRLLHSGNEVMKQLLGLIMLLSPVGLGVYFACQVAVTGPQLFGDYAQSLATGHIISIFYYLIVFTAYALLSGGWSAVQRYWRNNLLPSATALGTCSSVATIPANLKAAKDMGLPAPVADMVIPLGASLHKEGSAIAAVIKVAVALALAGRSMEGIDTILLAVLIAVLVSIIEGGIPNGGYVGQLLIVSAYQLPATVLPAIMIIGTLLDPVATLLNATGDTAAGLMINRLVTGNPAKLERFNRN
ncbi:dicarboxylate/amino acid:cation symporter [Chitinophaga pinensis]|uniref:Dicarboxylate/amino acid:cation symporter n=1 Tax=Chitinophaga pinensis TaxID=79329 RepID=A0A5C6LSC6_9BACT|nr:dicarboxylate/amino acid:cation symporter [Chitinophaga pinensis]TWV99583.1 dicarboxylate/amino acid:cation symporter [Chitinophaga pinensis]